MTATKKYRYYSTSESRNTLRALDRHLSKIGCPTEVKAVAHGKGWGWYELIVTGMLGKIVLRGCSWGYTGTGPHATRDVLVKLGIPQTEADALAFTTDGKDVGTPAAKGKVYFKRTLLPVVPPFTTYEVVEGKVVILS